MQKNVLIALAILGTLTVGFLVFRGHQNKETHVSTSALRDIYNQWKVNYKIHVGAAEDDYRFKVFGTNYGKIVNHNQRLGRTYSLGLNEFTHLTTEEFAATHLGLKRNMKVTRNVSILPTENLKTNVDWSTKMNPVKNQGMCGSCWAFSAVGAIEGLHSAVKGNLYDLSEQELVDCSSDYGNQGCNGGLMDQAFQYVQKAGGLACQKDYRYKGVDGKCQAEGKTKYGAITGYTDVPASNANALKAALNKQPVSVAIEADTFTFQGYTGGVINDASCGTNLDHGVVAVGYNDEGKNDANVPYFKVRNSWGSSWGEKGHVRIGIQDGDGICGIQMMASYPTA